MIHAHTVRPQLLSICAVALAGAVSTVAAQEQPPPAASGGLQEVVVTATRREESIQDRKSVV